jgi:hypothetical protein
MRKDFRPSLAAMILTLDRLGTVFVAGALFVTGFLSGCGGGPEKKDDNAMLAGGNVPAPPNVDRSKCTDQGKQVVTTDTNQDKKPDVWKFFATAQQDGQAVSVLTCKQVDLNHDGRVDIVYYYDQGGAQSTLEEFDLDFDGQFDLTVYYVNGKKVREEMDSNYDKRPDLWKYYEDEKLVRIERDTDYNGKIDEWQYYEGGKLDRIGYDTTGSGRVDRWDRAPEGEEGGQGGDQAAGAAAPPAGGGAAAPTGTSPPAATAPSSTSPPAATPAPVKAAKK